MTKRPRILIVDDDPALCEALRRYFWFYTDVRTALSVPDALCEIEQEAPDVVISDYLMPPDTGLDLFQAIRGEYPHIHRILHTGSPLDPESLLATQIIHAFVRKPGVAELLNAVFKFSSSLTNNTNITQDG